MTSKPLRFLVTGSAGGIGTQACRGLRDHGHFVRGLDIKPSPHADESLVADLADTAAVTRAAQGVDYLIHLGAWPTGGDFLKDMLGPNIVGVYNICEAARIHKIPRLMLCSSVQVLGSSAKRRTQLVRADEPGLPTNPYALTKTFLEDTGRMYAHVHKLAVVILRPCLFPRDEDHWKTMDTSESARDYFWSPADARRFFQAAANASKPIPGQCLFVWGVSRPLHKAYFDMTATHESLGYEPRDAWTLDARIATA